MIEHTSWDGELVRWGWYGRTSLKRFLKKDTEPVKRSWEGSSRTGTGQIRDSKVGTVLGKVWWRLTPILHFLAPRFSLLGDASVSMFLAITCFLCTLWFLFFFFFNQTQYDSEPRLWRQTFTGPNPYSAIYLLCVLEQVTQPLWQLPICKNGLKIALLWDCSEK